jgi:hypothetical protein
MTHETSGRTARMTSKAAVASILREYIRYAATIVALLPAMLVRARADYNGRGGEAKKTVEYILTPATQCTRTP